jgi:hypothetical protein
MSSTLLRIAGLGLSALALAFALGSCGKVADDSPGLFDSNTNWLLRCSDDLQCDGSLRCYCGICTKPCGQNSECGLLKGAQCAESGEILCGEQASAGGLCVLSCQQSSDCGDGFNCTSGQCVPKACVTLGARDWDEVFASIRDSLTRADPADAPYLRYFTIGNSSGDTDSAGGCGVEPEIKRQALGKLLNSLSLNPILSAPVGDRLFRIDLRDYNWNRPVQVRGGHRDVWEALVANDPYAVSFTGDAADEVIAATGTLVPVLLVDSFIATATEPAVYYGLLDVPELPVPFLVASAGAYVQGPGTVEAGFVDQQTEILARYWPMATRPGYVWSIADFGRAPGAVLATPLEDPLGERELVYTLPNGIHAFAFMSPSQQRLDSWRVTRDTAERDGVARVPRSNWRRHPAKVSVRDEVYDYLTAHFTDYPEPALPLLRQRFVGPEQLSLLLQRNYEMFTLPALITSQIDENAPDPILTTFAEFDRDVTLEVAAAELMVTPQSLRRSLALLDPALADLNGGSVARPVFTGLYLQTLCLLSTVLENQPAPGSCP